MRSCKLEARAWLAWPIFCARVPVPSPGKAAVRDPAAAPAARPAPVLVPPAATAGRVPDWTGALPAPGVPPAAPPATLAPPGELNDGPPLAPAPLRLAAPVAA